MWKTSPATGTLRELAPLAAVMLVGGAAWISFISLFNVKVLNQTPDWVRARVDMFTEGISCG